MELWEWNKIWRSFCLIWGLSGKRLAIVNVTRMVCMMWCNLAAKESGLEYAWVSNDGFTLLVRGGGRCLWVSMCTVWPSHSKWLNEYSNEPAPNFVLSLNIPLWKLFGWFKSPQLWATGDWQLYHHNEPTRASHFMQSFLAKHHPGDSAPLQPSFGALQLLAFPQTKITFESEEISDHWWDSGKYDGTADGNWKNCVRFKGAYFEGDWGVIVLCAMFLISCNLESSSINVSIFYVTWLSTFWTNLI